MLRHTLIAFSSFWAVCCTSALADESANRKIAASALRETRDIISRELFGHYDLTNLAVLKIEELRGHVSLGHDYGLVRATLEFSSKRNTTRHPTLNPNMFEPGNAMCQGWLYLHCGISTGHAFEGKLELLLADRGELFHHTGAREFSIRSMATCSWKDEKRKGTCCSQNRAGANNALPAVLEGSANAGSIG